MESTLLDLIFKSPSLSKSRICYYDKSEIPRRIIWDDIRSGSKTVLNAILSGASVVAVCIKASEWIPSILLGILESGAGFFCLSPAFDANYIRNQIQAAGASIVISSEDRFTDYFLCGTFDLGTQRFWLYSTGENANSELSSLAYVVQTSGSTGKPKMIKVTDSSIVPNILDIRKTLKVTPKDVLFLASALTFDPSVVEIFVSLLAGASLIIVNEAIKQDPTALARILFQEAKISILMCTPSLLGRFGSKIISTNILGETCSVRTLVLGGEAFPPLRHLRHPRNSTQLYNIYGLTELSCWATLHHVVNDEEKVPVGKCLSATKICVKDGTGAIIEEGEGEVWIGSESRRCMIDDKNFEEWIPTGDWARIANSQIWIIARCDRMLKRNGMRLNLNEIEKICLEMNEIQKAVAAFDGKELYLGLLAKETASKLCSEVRSIIKKKLPPQYYPDFVFLCHSDPVQINAHGKRDEQKTLAVLISMKKEAEPDPNLMEMFGIENDAIAIKDFGLDSLKSVALILQCEAKFGRQLPLGLGMIMSGCSIRDLFAYAAEDRKSPETLPDQLPSLTAEKKSSARKLEILEEGKALEADLIADGCCMEMLWSWDSKKCIDATPAVVLTENREEIVIATSNSGIIASLNGPDGTVNWEVQLPGRVVAAATPTLDGEFVICGCYDHFIYVLNFRTGHFEWKAEIGDSIRATAVVSESGLAFVGSYDDHFYAIDYRRRRVIWNNFVGSGVVSKACLSPDEKVVFVATLGSSVHAFFADTGVQCWTHSVGHPVFAGLNVLDEGIGEYSLIVASVDGTVTRFQSKKVSSVCIPEPIFTTPTISKGKLYTGRRIISIGEDVTKNGKKLDSDIVAAPFVVEQNQETCRILVSKKGRIEIFKETVLMCCVDLPGEMFGTAVLSPSAHIYVGCRDNRLYCFSLKKANSAKRIKLNS